MILQPVILATAEAAQAASESGITAGEVVWMVVFAALAVLFVKFLSGPMPTMSDMRGDPDWP